jgi:hypothetical protein
MSRRSYGSGSLEVRADSNGRETWYDYWRVGGRRVKRRLGLKRSPSRADGLTRVQAEQTMRQEARIAATSQNVQGIAGLLPNTVAGFPRPRAS